MALIRIYSGKSKPARKKPGWQKAAAEYAAWEAKLASQTLGASKLKVKPSSRPIKVQPQEAVVKPGVDPSLIRRGNSLITLDPIGGTKKVPRPEIMYRDNPEMLERELLAREIKHNVAPAFNKGGDQYVTQEELANQLRGNKRRP